MWYTTNSEKVCFITRILQVAVVVAAVCSHCYKYYLCAYMHYLYPLNIYDYNNIFGFIPYLFRILLLKRTIAYPFFNIFTSFCYSISPLFINFMLIFNQKRFHISLTPEFQTSQKAATSEVRGFFFFLLALHFPFSTFTQLV